MYMYDLVSMPCKVKTNAAFIALWRYGAGIDYELRLLSSNLENYQLRKHVLNE